MRYVLLGALFAVSASPVAVFAQAAPQPAAVQFVSVSGTISSADASAKTFTLKTDKGDSVVKYDDRTLFMRLAPGQTDTKAATPIQKTDVTTGDRVLARVRSGETSSAIPATRIYVFTKDDLAKRDEKTQEDWVTRSVTGIAQSVDTSAKTIVIKTRGPQGMHDVTVDVSKQVTFRRYNPESTKVADMKMSAINEITPGDQVRVLGEKNEDQTKVAAESIVSGAFRTVGVVVKTIDVAAGTITGTDANTKKPIVIKVTADSQVKRLEPRIAMMMAMQLNPNFKGMPNAGGAGASGAGGGRNGGGNGGGGNAGGNAGAGNAGAGNAGAGARGGNAGGPPAGMAAGANAPAGGPGGPGGGMRGGAGRMDTGKMLESQPTIQLAELKPGDALIVYGLVTPDMGKLASLNVIAGAEAILTAAPKGGADPLGGSWNFGGDSGPAQ